MNTIKTDPCGFTPRDTEQNWAAEYVRRLVANDVKSRIEADEAEAAARAAADTAEAAERKAADEAEETARKAADSSLRSAIISEELARKTADETEAAERKTADDELSGRIDKLDGLSDRVNELSKSALTKIPAASTDVLGGIKLYAVGGVNRSGLVIYGDGTAVVNTRPERGITRDGAGQIGINPATLDEVTAGEEAYKPITPSTLSGAFFRRNSFSRTLKQTGLWIDSTPVYRIAISITLTSSDFAAGYYKLKADDFGVKDVSYALVLNTALHVGFPAYGMEDCVPVEIGESLKIALNGIDTRYTTLYGYVDFITEADNIKED